MRNGALQDAKRRLRERAELDQMEDADLEMACILAEATAMQSDLAWATDIMYAVAESYNLHPGLHDQIMAFIENQQEDK